MSKWSFNKHFLEKLSDVLDISVNEISRRSNVNQPVLYHIIKGDTEMSVQVLLKVCNGLRIPSRYFICEDNNYIIPTRETATIEADHWTDISWSADAVEGTFGDAEGQINWKYVANVMGVTSQKPHVRFLLRTRFPIGGFLETCNYYNLSPFIFLNDPNRPNEIISKRLPTKNRKPLSPTPSYSELSRRMESLESTIADLQQKFIDLQQKYSDLYNDHIGMAAESTPEK